MSAPARRGALESWESLWFGEASLVRLAVCRIALMLSAFHAVMTHRFAVLQPARGLEVGYLDRRWQPLYLFGVLGIGPPGELLARTALVVICIAVALGLVGVMTRVACAITAIGTLWWIGVAYSFGQPHHGAVALVLGLAFLPFAPVGKRLSLSSLMRMGSGPPPERAAFANVPVLFTAITISIGYAAAGISKLVIGGLEWMNGYTFLAMLHQFDGPWTDAFSSGLFEARLFSVGLIAIQVGFPLALFFPRTRWILLPGAFTFHLMAMMTMETGPFLSLWTLLVVFVPCEQVPGWLDQRLLEGPSVRRWLWAVISVGALVLYLALFLPAVPTSLRPVVVLLALAPVAAYIHRVRVRGGGGVPTARPARS